MDLAGATVLVTGASGFLGRRVVRAAHAYGARVVATGRTAPIDSGADQAVALQPDDRLAIADLLSRHSIDAVLHLAAAGVHGQHDLVSLLAANVGSVAALLDAAAERPSPPTVVAAGSCSEYPFSAAELTEDVCPAPFTGYGVSKAAATSAAALWADTVPIVVLRPFQVYGPGERVPRLFPSLLDCAARGEPLRLKTARAVRDFVYVDEVAEAFWRTAAGTATHPGLQVVNVGTGIGTTVAEAAQLAVAALRRRGVRAEVAIADTESAVEPGYVADLTRLRATLGWAPSVTLEDGLGRMMAEELLSSRR